MLKRLLCLLLSMTFIMGSVAAVSAADFSDVKDDNPFKEAIYTLSEFGIILGDAGANTFRPDAEISREEFSVIVTRILGVSNIKPDLTVLPFDDVTPIVCDEWAIIATKMAYDLGIVSGYGDGKFGPKNPVTYEQVVKMLVCALGYQTVADEKGGWPSGYLAVGRELGITDDTEHIKTSDNAPRGVVAQLVYNCLEVNLMAKNADGKPYIQTGHNIIVDKLGYIKEDGIVTGIKNLALTSAGSQFDDDDVEFDNNLLYKAGTTSVRNYFGYSGEFYYKSKGSTRTIISFMPSDKNNVWEIPADLVVSVSENNIKFYEDETGVKSDTLELKGAKYLYNGQVTNLSEIKRPNIGDMKLIDNNGDEIVDIVIVNDAEVVVVSAVDSVRKIYTNKYNPSKSLDLSGNYKKCTITKDGKEAKTSDITKGSVLMVSESSENISVEIITKTVSGKVTGTEDGGESVSVDNGKMYECSSAFWDYLASNPGEKMQIGDQVKLFIGAEDKIMYATVSVVQAKYGYMIGADFDDKTSTGVIKLLDASNKISVYECVEKLIINDERVEYDKIPDKFEKTNTLTNKDSGAKSAETAQLVKYTMSGGKIDSVTTLSESGDILRDLVLSVPYNDKEVIYNSTTKSFKDKATNKEINVSIDSSTKVFLIPTDRASDDDYVSRTGSGLTNAKSYKIEAYNVTDTGVAGAIVVYGNTVADTISWKEVALVSGISEKINEDNVVVNSVELITNGAKSTRNTENKKLFADIKKGDIIRYAINSKGIIVDAEKVFSPTNEDFTFTNKAASGKHTYTHGSKNSSGIYQYNYVCGTVYSRDDDRMLVSEAIVDENGELDDEATKHAISFTDKAVYYLYDSSSRDPLTITDITSDYLTAFRDSPTTASKVVVYRGYTTLKFVYIIR